MTLIKVISVRFFLELACIPQGYKKLSINYIYLINSIKNNFWGHMSLPYGFKQPDVKCIEN